MSTPPKKDEAGNDRTIEVNDAFLRSLKQKGIHICNECGKLFKKKFDLDQHLRIHSGEKPFECQICSKAFTQKSNLNKHLKTHEVWKNGHLNLNIKAERTASSKENLGQASKLSLKLIYSCSICTDGQTFDTKRSLQKHMKIHPGQKGHKCAVCEKLFPELEDLLCHEFEEHEGRTENDGGGGDPVTSKRCENPAFYCKYCKETFTSRIGLKLHNLSVDHKLPCPGCPPTASGDQKTYGNEKLLREHLKECHSDTTLMAYPCHICQKVFQSEHYLRSHYMTHTGELPFTCSKCDAAFNRKDTLKRHMLVHEDENVKKFKCPVAKCKKNFSRLDKLRDHVKTH